MYGTHKAMRQSCIRGGRAGKIALQLPLHATEAWCEQTTAGQAEERMGKLDGKVAIVTGASRGIGADIARVFAAEGSKVICTARTLKEGTHPLEGSLEKTVADIQAAGGEA